MSKVYNVVLTKNIFVPSSNIPKNVYNLVQSSDIYIHDDYSRPDTSSINANIFLFESSRI